MLFYKIFTESRLVMYPVLTINFTHFRKYLARFATPFTAQYTTKFAENERNIADAPHKTMKKA